MEDCRKVAFAHRRNNTLRYFLYEEMGLQLDGALENLEKRVPKVKVGNRESLRQKDSVDIYINAKVVCFSFALSKIETWVQRDDSLNLFYFECKSYG